MRKNSSEYPLIQTRDGSHTVYSNQFDQHYHNPNGALSENKYVFFEQTGLPKALSTEKELSMLEVGFGTGLSLMLLLDYYRAANSKTTIDYYAVEGFPLTPKTVQHFNYGQYLEHSEAAGTIEHIFSNLTAGMNHFNLNNGVQLHLFNGMFKNFNPPAVDFNYIFHDAFSPDANPGLWTGDVFKRLKQMSATDVLLSTYCAASKAQGALAWAGWKVAKARGALGKREMILAALDAEQLTGHKRINEKHYARRYEAEDF